MTATGPEIFYSNPERFLKLYNKYKAKNEKGVLDGYLFFNKQQVIEEAVSMSLWIMEQSSKNKV
jgi:hypothetical protein